MTEWLDRELISRRLKAFVETPAAIAPPRGRSSAAPLLSIIMPSYNKARFLERAIRSVLNQRYSNIEFLVVDGGSTDGSVDIIRKYEKHLAYWVSEGDRGQSHALNKALDKVSGDWIGWQNADDVYFPGALHAIARSIQMHASATVHSGIVATIDVDDGVTRIGKFIRPSCRRILYEGWILSSQGVFWARRCGLRFDESLEYAMDLEFFFRLLSIGEAVFVPNLIGGFRVYPGTKSQEPAAPTSREGNEILARLGVNRESPLSRVTRAVLRIHRMAHWYWLMTTHSKRILADMNLDERHK